MSNNFQFDTRPEIDVIVYRHKTTCAYTKKEQDGRCRCPKHIYVRLLRARISAKTRSWDTARQRAKEWADNHDPVILRERARESENAITPKLIEEAFDEFIASKQAASSNPDGYMSMTRVSRTLSACCTFTRSHLRCSTSGRARGNLRPTGPNQRNATTPLHSLTIALRKNGSRQP